MTKHNKELKQKWALLIEQGRELFDVFPANSEGLKELDKLLNEIYQYYYLMDTEMLEDPKQDYELSFFEVKSYIELSEQCLDNGIMTQYDSLYGSIEEDKQRLCDTIQDFLDAF